MSGFDDAEEEYRGPATVVFPGADPDAAGEDADIAVQTHVAGRFDPLHGRYRWVGRLAPHPRITAAAERGLRALRLTTPDGYTGEGELGEVNPWGGYRVSGTGAPPFPLPVIGGDELEEDDGSWPPST